MTFTPRQQAAVEMALAVFDLPWSAITCRDRDPVRVEARQIMAVMLHEAIGMSYPEIAGFCGGGQSSWMTRVRKATPAIRRLAMAIPQIKMTSTPRPRTEPLTAACAVNETQPGAGPSTERKDR